VLDARTPPALLNVDQKTEGFSDLMPNFFPFSFFGGIVTSAPGGSLIRRSSHRAFKGEREKERERERQREREREKERARESKRRRKRERGRAREREKERENERARA
jgi:uncharacterized protein (DUF2062 family)